MKKTVQEKSWNRHELSFLNFFSKVLLMVTQVLYVSKSFRLILDTCPLLQLQERSSGTFSGAEVGLATSGAQPLRASAVYIFVDFVFPQ